MSNTVTYTITDHPLVHPNAFLRVNVLRGESFDEEMQDVGVRLAFIASAFPSMPCGDAMAWAEGKATYTVNGDVGTLTVTREV